LAMLKLRIVFYFKKKKFTKSYRPPKIKINCIYPLILTAKIRRVLFRIKVINLLRAKKIYENNKG